MMGKDLVSIMHVFNSLRKIFCLKICLTFGKVFEVMLLLQLVTTNWYTNEVSLTALVYTLSVSVTFALICLGIRPSQHGFMKGRSLLYQRDLLP